MKAQTISQIAETKTGVITSIQSIQKGFLGTTIYTMVVDSLGDVYTSTKKTLKVGQRIDFITNVKVADNGNDFGSINLRIL